MLESEIDAKHMAMKDAVYSLGGRWRLPPQLRVPFTVKPAYMEVVSIEPRDVSNAVLDIAGRGHEKLAPKDRAGPRRWPRDIGNTLSFFNDLESVLFQQTHAPAPSSTWTGFEHVRWSQMKVESKCYGRARFLRAEGAITTTSARTFSYTDGTQQQRSMTLNAAGSAGGSSDPLGLNIGATIGDTHTRTQSTTNTLMVSHSTGAQRALLWEVHARMQLSCAVTTDIGFGWEFFSAGIGSAFNSSCEQKSGIDLTVQIRVPVVQCELASS